MSSNPPHFNLDCQGSRPPFDDCCILRPHAHHTDAESSACRRNRDGWLHAWCCAIQGSSSLGHPLNALLVLWSAVLSVHCYPCCLDQELSSLLQQLDYPACVVDKRWISCHGPAVRLLPWGTLETLRAVLQYGMGWEGLPLGKSCDRHLWLPALRCWLAQHQGH